MPQISGTRTDSPERLDCRTAQFDTARPQPSTAIVTAHGELDAANCTEFVDYALRNSEDTERLIIDLSGLTFFATAGFTALHTLNVQCVGAEIQWALVPSPAVHRLLRICDPDAALPISPDVEGALTAVHDELRRLLELVPEPS